VLPLLGVRAIAGRQLGPSDGGSAPHVAVISRAMADRFWPGGDPLHSVLHIGLGPAAPAVTVVGVVADLQLNWYDADPRAVIYLPHAQGPARQMDALVRSSGDPRALASQIRGLVKRLDPLQPVSELQPFATTIDESISPVRIVGILLFVAGGIAVMLAA